MEYEGTFTEEDAENDGEIKRYAGKQAAQVAARQDSQLYDMFLKVCERKGLEPWEVFGDHIIRAINNEPHAEKLAGTEVNMARLQKGSVRKEDAKFLKEFAEQLGISVEPDDSSSELDNIFKDRLKSQLESPLASMSNKGGGEVNEELVKEVKRLRREMSEMKSEGDVDTATQGPSGDMSSGGGKNVDEAFDEAMSSVSGDDGSEEDVDSSTEGEDGDIDEDGGEDYDGDNDNDEAVEEDGEDEQESGPSVKPGPMGLVEEEDEGIPGSNQGEVEDE